MLYIDSDPSRCSEMMHTGKYANFEKQSIFMTMMMAYFCALLFNLDNRNDIE